MQNVFRGGAISEEKQAKCKLHWKPEGSKYKIDNDGGCCPNRSQAWLL